MVVGEIFLGAFIQVLFQKLASDDLWKFTRKERRTHTLLKEWTRMLEQVEAVVADAEEKQVTNRSVNLWLEDLEDLAYDMEDVLDEFATEALGRKVMEEARASTSKVRALMPNCCTSFNPSTLVSDFRMRSEMDEITKRLQELFNRRMGLGLQNIAAGGSDKAPQRRPTSSLTIEPCLYGRDNDKMAIIELLLSDQPSSNKVGVVPIVGMGGVGKTTLAQMVYNDEMVDKHFEVKAWVCVSEEFDIIGVTKSILVSITSRTCNFQALDQVQIELKKALAGKKFLIVLDDVWNKNHSDWSSLKSPFIDGTLGSKVIVTTRNMDVALIMAGNNKYHFLKELSKDDCWSVFAQHAFEDRSMDASPNLVSIGMKIVEKCKGLPLAARTLGGLLRCKFRDDEWEEVLNNKIWELSEEDSHILPALRLSYYHLPSHLKKCFAYCSILPKDYEFEEKELVFLWMAEGLISKQTVQKQMEDLGCEYFHELLSRSFFQPSRSGEVFVMHDLINDLAQFFARKICFSLEDKLKESEGDKSMSKARHSSYTRGRRDGVKKFEAFHKAKNLRTFLPCGSRYEGYSYLTSNVPLNLLPGLRRLRVLSLRRYRIFEISSSIGDLKHVRYLDLSCALILTLPESIGTLYNLQTLILRDCKNLTELPISTSNLINLRHLDVTGADSLREMPPKIGNLRSLQTLSNYIICNGNESTIKQLGNLINLRGTLSISGLEKVADALDARRANLTDKQGLDVLLMKWSNISHNSRNGSVESKVFDMLRPHKNLKELSIDGYGGLRFPTWVGNSLFSNMVCLKFQNCEKCTSLPPLGHLPLLAKLYVKGMKAVENVGLDFYGLGCSNPFPALEILTFEDMPEWKVWTPFVIEEEAQAFARLSELYIKRCPKLLHVLPRNLPRLKQLKITGCPVLVVTWGPSLTELNEVRNTLHFDSLVSLHLADVSIPDSYIPEVRDQAVRENSRHSLLSSLTSLKVKNIRGHKCLPSWFFHGLTGLQQFHLSDCEDLTTLWENEVSLQHRLPALRSLTVEGCPRLISLFAEVEEGDDFKSLQELFISYCPRLISFPKTGLASTLRNLSIVFCKLLQSLLELTLLNNLEKLEIFHCSSLTYLSSRCGLPPTLRDLRVVDCEKLISIIAEEGMKINCPSLESISIRNCKRLKTLPDVTQNNGLRNLRELGIHDCDNLESLPEGWFPATNLRRLDIRRCEKLDPLPNHTYKNNDDDNNNNNLGSLEQLELIGSSPAAIVLVSHILDEGSSFYFTNLTSLTINNVDINKLCGFRRFCFLRELTLINCDCVSFPEDGMLSLPPSLIDLYISEFQNLDKLSCKDIVNLVSLEHLGVFGCPKLTSIPELGLLPSLSKLSIYDCCKLTSISELGLLPSLSNLSISYCPNLASFPEHGLPPSLLSLVIYDCPKLKQRFEKGKGQYWSFITHIPELKIDGRSVFQPRS